ncbi:ABC transporter permease (plasmid) [Halorussus salilacus]|uniref:ABC transporter permease n=1 Tax=Halorussus salilacus TaxID=2953750 RepID=UPI0020A12B5A|nr:ABC transporter permease [Halorussus salilacus]USZ69732.1 ABC transporter permease [Halorussus salilacus]
MGKALVRWTGLVGVALRRTATKATRTAPRQTAVSVAGVAIAVALMLVVTATGLGLVEGTTVRGDAVDYWVVPESTGTSTMVVSADAPKLGDVHGKSTELTDDGRIEYATPVLVEVVEVRAEGSAEYVLAVGVIPAPELDDIAGLSPGALAPGDPHYADGDYDGEWTGEAVLSRGAADRLGVESGASMSVSGAVSAGETRDLRAVDVREAAVESGLSGLPVMVVHLSELQTITGAQSGDQADQILVESSTGGLEAELGDRYEGATAVTRSGFAAQQTTDAELPLAMGLAALLIAIVVGALFVATTQGLQVEADSEQLAALSALGFSRRARAVVLVVQALALTLVGGALGIVLAYAATALTNYAATRAIAPVPIADFHPLLVVYGLGVSALIGVLVAPYLLAMEGRIDDVTEVIR